IFSSPLERARETAGPLSAKLRLPIETVESFKEIDFAGWTNRKFSDLDKEEPSWRQWNAYRSGGWIPGGEAFVEVQARMVLELETLRRKFPEERVAIFSHGDPLRAALQYYLGMPLDLFHRIELTPAGYSILELTDWGARLHTMNATVHLGKVQPSY
ncbi:MAG TPA: histidine phosphatase family protein, partial [Verrucomicrobiae bacterium]|nr:histidine phosphatase family protein [Verrucomicrobiae bacterium]